MKFSFLQVKKSLYIAWESFRNVCRCNNKQCIIYFKSVSNDKGIDVLQKILLFNVLSGEMRVLSFFIVQIRSKSTAYQTSQERQKRYRSEIFLVIWVWT